MQSSKYIIGKNKIVLTLNVIKIAIIVFTAVNLIGYWTPFYLGADAHLYGLSAVNLANGSWGFTNELLQEMGLSELVPRQFVKTVHNTAVPVGNPGIHGIATVFYLLGGYYGLFFLGPIFTILLLIFSERIATKLFGGFAGLVTLVTVSTNAMIFVHGIQLLTNSIYSVFFILGCFYLIKFLREKRAGLIFLCSVFLATSTFFRMEGLISLPLEIFLVVGYFTFQNLTQTKKELNSKNTTLIIKQIFSKIRIKKLFKISALMLIPWLVFFSFLFSYNSYYFGEPFTDYVAERPDFEHESSQSFFQIDSERIAWIKYYLAALLPSQPEEYYQGRINIEDFDSFGINWQSALVSVILFSALGIALYSKNKRTEVIVLLTFVAGMLFFYSSNNVISAGPLNQRYMIPAITLSFIVLGFTLSSIWNIKLRGTSIKLPKILSEIFIGGFIIIVIIFFIVSFYNSIPIQDDFYWHDPEKFAKKYPLDTEGLTENSVIISVKGRWVVDYNAIPFYPFWDYQEPIDAENKKLDHVPSLKTSTLKKIMREGYDVYAFKSKGMGEINYFEYIKTEYGLVLKDYSNTFCKLELIKNVDEIDIDTKADSVCYRKEIITPYI